jgi:hypothetical protein
VIKKSQYALILFCISVLLPRVSLASLDLGVGESSVTSGRLVPALAGGITTSTWAVFVSSTGVKSGYYYHSAYNLAVLKMWNSGDLFWGSVESGLGVGALYSERGFQDDRDASTIIRSDYGIGPQFRARWYVAGPVYTSVDVMLGVGNVLNLVLLSFQDSVVFSIGVTTW